MPSRIPAPELDGRGGWIGVRPLTLSRLRGKAVLVYFWSASSVECQRLVEDLRPVEDLFADELVVVGVHTPRFPAEADHRVVADAVVALGIAHPVLDDPDLSLWEAYGARQWPTVVLVGPTGEVAGAVAGEDCGAVLEKAVTEVLERHAALNGRVRRRLVAVERALPPDGPLAFPGKVASSPDGRLLAVADTAHDRVLICSLDGVVLEAHTGFLRPQGVRFDAGGVVVCDTLADRVVRTDGEVLADSVVSPWDLVSDGRAWVVAEAGGHRLLRVRPGELRTRLVAGTGAEGAADGPVEKSVLAQPSGVACTAEGIAFVDAGASSLRLVVEERRAGAVSTLVGDRRLESGDADGPPEVARLQFPLGVAADPRIAGGPVYVADTYNDAIRVWEGGRLRTLPVRGLRRPGGIDLLPDGRLVVADTGHHRIVVVDPATGSVTPVDVDETWVHGADGPPVRLAPGRSLSLDVGIPLVDEELDCPAGAGAPVEVVVSSRPAGLLAGGPVRVTLPAATGVVDVAGGHPGVGLLLVEVTARTRGSGGPASRVQRRADAARTRCNPGRAAPRSAPRPCAASASACRMLTPQEPGATLRWRPREARSPARRLPSAAVRAATIADGEVVVVDRPDPVPGTGEVLVRVRAAGVNAADLLQRVGNYPAPPGSPPDIPGLEVAGEVTALGPGAHRFSVGERVMAVVGGGGQAELCVVHERLAMPVPPATAWVVAGGFPEAFTTAHDALFTQCGLAMGERVLVSGAAGGVGTSAVQLAVAAGASVTGSVRNPATRAGVAALGAAVVAPEEVVGSGPYNVVLELVGAANLVTDLAELAVGGRVTVIGVGAGSRAEVDLRVLMERRASVRGSTLRARPLEAKADAARRMETHVLPLLEHGTVTVPVAATFPLEQVGAAYDRFAAGGKLGKLVLTM